MDAANAWQDDEDEDEDDDDEDESTEFEDDDIADYVHEMELDEEVLSEIRNNLMSPTDIDPFLISNLQGVRIRASGFPSIHGMSDTGKLIFKEEHSKSQTDVSIFSYEMCSFFL